MNPWMRILALCLCTVLVLTVLLSAAFLLASAAHICIGNGCPVCARMQLCTLLLKKSLAPLLLFSGILLTGIFSPFQPDAFQGPEAENTPVRMKVKLSC